MPRSKKIGLLLVTSSLIFGILFFYYTYGKQTLKINLSYENIDLLAYYILSIPIILITITFLGLGFWIGYTILVIKVVPMPEFIKKKNFTKPKAFLLCSITLALFILFIYGLYLKNFWAIAIPVSMITLIILGAVFWVGLAILTTRTTLAKNQDDK